MREGYDLQILKFRSQHHGGLSWDEVRMSSERKARARIRSSPDRRLFDGMSSEQEEAFLRIGFAHRIINAGLGAKVQSFENRGTGLGSMELGAALVAWYKCWKELCKKRYISPLMAEDIIIYGLSLRESDAGRKMRNGTAKTNLIKCLDAWWDVRDGDVDTMLEGKEKIPLAKPGPLRDDS